MGIHGGFVDHVPGTGQGVVEAQYLTSSAPCGLGHSIASGPDACVVILYISLTVPALYPQSVGQAVGIHPPTQSLSLIHI